MQRPTDAALPSIRRYLLARVVGIESAENWLGGYRKRHFQMGEQNIVSDSGHGRIENKLGT